MTTFHAMLVFVVVQRLTELVWSARNTRRLLARGAQEIGARHYPLFVLLHGSWLIALALIVPADAQPHWPLLGLFVMLQLLRLWVVAALGPYWTTRIITLPNAPLVRHGPFRWLNHPNYAVVVGEIAVLPLAFGSLADRAGMEPAERAAALASHPRGGNRIAISARDRIGYLR